MKNSFTFFIGTAKNIRLSTAEKMQSKDVLYRLLLSTPSTLTNSGKLFAYEKALMWNMLRNDVARAKPVEETTEPFITLTVWHGSIFSHLEPFVLAGR